MPDYAKLRADNEFVWQSPDLDIHLGVPGDDFPQGNAPAGIYRVLDKAGNDLSGRVRFRAGKFYRVLRTDNGTIDIKGH